MKIKLSKGAYMPSRAYPTDAGLDIRCPQGCGCIVPAKESVKIYTGVHVELPEGTVGLLKSKSGLMCKHGLVSEGVVDVGYSGEIVVKLFNHSGMDYRIEEGSMLELFL